MHKQMFTRFLAVVTLGAAVFAAHNAAAAELKIASVHTRELLALSPQYKASQDKFKAEFEKRQKDFDAEVKKFQDDVAQFRKEDGTLASTESDRRKKDLATREVDLNTKAKQLQEDSQTRQGALFQDIQTKINEAIGAFAKEKGYDLIVADPAFSTDAVDVTDELLKSMGAAPAPAKAKK